MNLTPENRLELYVPSTGPILRRIVPVEIPATAKVGSPEWAEPWIKALRGCGCGGEPTAGEGGTAPCLYTWVDCNGILTEVKTCCGGLTHEECVARHAYNVEHACD